jgi:hypothetical protein
VTLPTLHEGQIELWNVPGRYMAVRCGRRWGKTLYASTIICDGAARGENWGLFAPDYKITSETYRDIFEILEPITISASKIDGVIRCVGGGRVDFWTLNNPRAGRSRKYHGVIIDEAAFAGPDMADIWAKSIKPTLLDYKGVGWALSTPSGKDDENWFYAICNQPDSEFTEFHAPTSANPYLPADEVARLEADNSPEVYRQEYLAEFVDWSGVAFFPVDSLLVPSGELAADGKPIMVPVPTPDRCDTVLAIIDTAIRSGQEHNSTGVIWGSYNSLLQTAPVNILDYELIQIEGADQAGWLPSVYARGEELARLCGARRGFSGAIIEDKATGTVLIQQATNLRREGVSAPAFPIDSKLTALGKDERAIAASKYVYRGDIKITEYAFNKIVVNKRISANHLLKQIGSFRVGSKVKDGLDLLDCFCYLVLMTRGSNAGERKGI